MVMRARFYVACRVSPGLVARQGAAGENGIEVDHINISLSCRAKRTAVSRRGALIHLV